jgi:hypothetical protein
MLQVTWEPYDGERALPFQLSNMCGSNNELYRVRCPLICFYAVEYHLPHRVAREFEARQLWPPDLVSTGVTQVFSCFNCTVILVVHF